ncbi:hypothetical protein F4815DRAFT_453730 [Daldinia loculata]|nr:hypothetical protein F4815DRAFT_453730 [Daldinia loculata]
MLPASPDSVPFHSVSHRFASAFLFLLGFLFILECNLYMESISCALQQYLAISNPQTGASNVYLRYLNMPETQSRTQGGFPGVCAAK